MPHIIVHCLVFLHFVFFYMYVSLLLCILFLIITQWGNFKAFKYLPNDIRLYVNAIVKYVNHYGNINILKVCQ